MVLFVLSSAIRRRIVIQAKNLSKHEVHLTISTSLRRHFVFKKPMTIGLV
jgi:hypothetical protein